MHTNMVAGLRPRRTADHQRPLECPISKEYWRIRHVSIASQLSQLDQACEPKLWLLPYQRSCQVLQNMNRIPNDRVSTSNQHCFGPRNEAQCETDQLFARIWMADYLVGQWAVS